MRSFAEIYKINDWGFGSGHGSRPSATRGYRSFVEGFIQDNAIRSVVDFGCGDWQFSRLIDWNGADYIGLDIVPELIDGQNAQYGTEKIRFALAPQNYDDLPAGDLLLIKDVLQHWAAAEIRRFAETALPKFRYALVTNCVTPQQRLNIDIETGAFRPLDLRRPPFNFDVPAVYGFDVPKAFSWRKRKTYPGSRKVVLLIENPTARETL